MIVVRIFGGLGNQMFQYAFGKALAIKYKHELKLDISYFDEKNYPFELHADYYPFKLGNYNIEEKLTSKWLSLVVNIVRWKGIFRMSNKISQYPGLNRVIPYYVNQSNVDFKIFRTEKATIILDGYWQNYSIIEEFRAEIIKSLMLNTISDKCLRLASKVQGNNTVSIHFRKGDYLSNPKFREVYADCSVEYYFEAMKYFKKIYPNPKYFIFSDNISWVKENIQLSEDMQIVSEDIPDHEQQYLMSSCAHNITANSSFSWWGAWLNIKANHITISPKNWYREEKRAKDILRPKEWIFLEDN